MGFGMNRVIGKSLVTLPTAISRKETLFPLRSSFCICRRSYREVVGKSLVADDNFGSMDPSCGIAETHPVAIINPAMVREYLGD
jgi:hypothetical protein